MTISRRILFKSSLAVGTLFVCPSILRAQAQDNQTVRMITEDLQVFDPVFTTSTVTHIHSLAIYDTLFALDEKLHPQPQMVGYWSVSDDKKTHSFKLRDGLNWHDGTPVTAADCVASIRRWWGVTPSGQALQDRTAGMTATGETTFTITLHEPYELVLETLTGAFMMRGQDAKLPASEQVTANIGSGPFKFNAKLTRPGSRVVYDRNERYVARNEPASGLAGGKVVKVDQVVWENISDPQTSLAALQAGEIDFWLGPVPDLFPAIKADPKLVLDTLGVNGVKWEVVMNHLQPPFDNLKMRQALLHLIDQKAFLSLLSPDPQFGRTVTSLFTVGSAYSNDVNTDWFKEGGDLEKAKQLIKEAGYAGEKVVILDPTDWAQAESASQLLASVLQKADINAELAPMTWSELVVRRQKMDPVKDSGWSIFISYFSDFSWRDPLSSPILSMNGRKAYYGWPQSDEYEALRNKWPDTKTMEERQELAREMQRVWWEQVAMVFLGQTLVPSVRRTSLVDMVNFPAQILPMWNMRKVEG
ncbi:ABC transporter substrate-binding protein [Mesorhizobium sp. M0115]|uniref:ABC transporter substrate-binding protein n=1 Tax=Mesorhizobium sp. M0115 TaxID=2956883 RepID=UPI00333AC939